MIGGVYLINFLGGSSGAFLTSLVCQIVDKPIDDQDIIFGSNGDSHDLSDLHTGNSSIQGGQYDMTDIPQYIVKRPKDPNRPLVMLDHCIPVYDDLYSIFPECKNIVITVPKSMYIRLCGNMFFKNTISGYPGNIKFWQEQLRLLPYLNNIENPIDVPLDVAQKYITDYAKGFKTGDFYSPEFITDEKYKKHVCRINFYALIHNPDIVLDQLSNITEKPILPEHINFYTRYLEKQQEMVSRNMPWLDDK